MLATDLDSESRCQNLVIFETPTEHPGEGFSKMKKILALRPSQGAA